MALSPTQRQDFALSSFFDAPWLAFAQFDPALGTLSGVTVAVTTVASGSVSVENLDAGPVTVQAGLPVSVGTYIHQYSFLSTSTATASGSVTLAAFDGTADFTGPSGAVLAGLSGSHTETFALAADDWRASAFLGVGSVSLIPRGSNSVGVSGGAGLRLLSEPGPMTGEIAVTYDYVPRDSTTGSVTTIVGGGSVTLEGAGSGAVQTVTGGRQLRSVAAQTTGWTQAVTLDGFDPARGSLVAVNLRLRTSFNGSVGVENLGAVHGWTSFTQGVVATASVAGVAGALTSARGEASVQGWFLDSADGMVDFAGGAGFSIGWGGGGNGAARVTDPAAVGAFVAAGPVEVSLQAQGTGRIEGVAALLAQMQATASAVLEVSYTYSPAGDFTPIAVANGSLGTQDLPVPVGYAGPVAGVVNEFARITPDNLAVSAASDSWYIRTGSGTDAIQVSGGTNVLDGGGGSNYLVGGAGQDTFFVDATWTTAPLWNTIDGFASGDAATIWGLTSWGHLLSWRDGQGAAGAEGLTLHARAPGLPPVSTTFVGYSSADLSNGVLELSFGTAGDVPYMHIRAV